MTTGVLFHMLGLGDHISYNGMARRMVNEKRMDALYILAWHQYAQSVAYMFSDDPRIRVVAIGSGMEYVHSRQVISQINPDYIYILGHAVLPGQPFDDLARPDAKYYQESWASMSSRFPGGHECYYNSIEMDWKHRFTSFHYPRNMQEENRLFNKLNPDHKEYVFIQDDPSRGFSFDKEKVLSLVGKDVIIINNDKTENLFNYGLLIQNAKQVHLMESSFRCFVETLPTEGVEFYLHHYIRNSERLVYDGKICPRETRKPWQVIL